MISGIHHIGVKVGGEAGAVWLRHVCSEAQAGWLTGPNVHLKLEVTPTLARATKQPRPVNQPGIAHICLQSRDIQDGLARGVEAGLTPISPPVNLGTPFRYLYAHTDDGILLELEGAPFVEDTEPRFWIGHIAFVAREIERLVAFYAAMLGLKSGPVSRFRNNARIDRVAGLTDVDLSAMWLPGLNVGLEFWQYHNPVPPNGLPEPRTGFEYVCFETTEFQTDCENTLSQGAVRDGRQDFGMTGCETARFRDPEGNRFMLISFADGDDPRAVKNLPHRDVLAKVSTQL